MKKLIIILFALVMMSATAFGQQDPLDAGGPDSMIIVVTQPNVEGNDSTLTVSVFFVNDVQDLQSATAGFKWDNPNLVVDSAKLSPAAASAFTFPANFWFKGNVDSSNANRLFQLGIFGTSSLAASANRQLIATYWFHVQGWDVNDSVVIDTVVFGGGTVLKFVDFAGPQYAPFWGGSSTIKDVSGITVLRSNNLPSEFAVTQNYPNPFNPITTIAFDVPVPSEVNIAVFNVLGQRVTTLVNGRKEAGEYTIDWNGTSDGGNRVASGIYFYRITAGDFVKTKKMMMLK